MPKKSASKPKSASPSAEAEPRTLAIDIGGTGVKCTVLDPKGAMLHERMRVDTPVDAPPAALIDAVVKMAKDLPSFDRISAGYPGAVRRAPRLPVARARTDASSRSEADFRAMSPEPRTESVLQAWRKSHTSDVPW